MFSNLFNLGIKRSVSQAIGFYIVYVLIGLLLAGVIGEIFGLFYPEVNGIIIGGTVGAIYTFLVYFYCYYLKNLHSIYLILLGLILGVIAYFFGILFSFIAVSYLTTKGDSSDDEPNNILGSDEQGNNI